MQRYSYYCFILFLGILNKEGKEIYSFKVDEIDDKNIDIEISPVSDNVSLENRYAKIKLNDSYTIVNLKTGKKVDLGPTLFDNYEFE